MGFISIEKSNYLTAKDMTTLYENFLLIKNLLYKCGYDAGNMEIRDNSVAYNISPAAILEKMNMVEQNITAIHEAILKKDPEWEDTYYKAFKWIPIVWDRRVEVWRWIDWQNEIYNFLSSNLRDITNSLIFDINNEQITVSTEI